MILPENYLVEKTSSTEAKIIFTLQESLFYLKGHFKAQPILPGVIQLGWAIHFAKELFKISTKNDMPQVKFTQPIMPNDKIELSLKLNRELNNFTFEYYLENTGKVASSGKVKIND